MDLEHQSPTMHQMVATPYFAIQMVVCLPLMNTEEDNRIATLRITPFNKVAEDFVKHHGANPKQKMRMVCCTTVERVVRHLHEKWCHFIGNHNIILYTLGKSSETVSDSLSRGELEPLLLDCTITRLLQHPHQSDLLLCIQFDITPGHTPVTKEMRQILTPTYYPTTMPVMLDSVHVGYPNQKAFIAESNIINVGVNLEYSVDLAQNMREESNDYVTLANTFADDKEQRKTPPSQKDSKTFGQFSDTEDDTMNRKIGVPVPLVETLVYPNGNTRTCTSHTDIYKNQISLEANMDRSLNYYSIHSNGGHNNGDLNESNKTINLQTSSIHDTDRDSSDGSLRNYEITESVNIRDPKNADVLGSNHTPISSNLNNIDPLKHDFNFRSQERCATSSPLSPEKVSHTKPFLSDPPPYSCQTTNRIITRDQNRDPGDFTPAYWNNHMTDNISEISQTRENTTHSISNKFAGIEDVTYTSQTDDLYREHRIQVKLCSIKRSIEFFVNELTGLSDELSWLSKEVRSRQLLSRRIPSSYEYCGRTPHRERINSIPCETCYCGCKGHAEYNRGDIYDLRGENCHDLHGDNIFSRYPYLRLQDKNNSSHCPHCLGQFSVEQRKFREYDSNIEANSKLDSYRQCYFSCVNRGFPVHGTDLEANRCPRNDAHGLQNAEDCISQRPSNFHINERYMVMGDDSHRTHQKDTFSRDANPCQTNYNGTPESGFYCPRFSNQYHPSPTQGKRRRPGGQTDIINRNECVLRTGLHNGGHDRE